MIRVSGLNKYFNKGRSNELHVINDVTLELPDKGFITILGRSGSGKTTLLNVIGGLDTFSKGSIAYEEEVFTRYNMSEIDKYRTRNIGYIFQNYLVMPDETVFENIDTSLKLAGFQDKAERKKRANEALKAVGMSKYRRKTANSLSGGQKQRIGIARAIAKLPKIIIADEPTGNLDSENSIEIMAILKDISQKYLVLMVTHNEKLAKNFADRIIRYQDGQIIGDELNTPSSDLRNLVNASRSNIYLSDLKKKSVSNNGIKAEVYSESDPKIDLNIKIVEADGRKYLFIDDEDYVINDPSVTLIEKRVEEEKTDKISTFDASEFNETVRKPVPFFSLLKQAFFAFFHDSKFKTTTYKILSGLMGIGISVVSLLTYYTFYSPDYMKSMKTMETSTLSITSIETGPSSYEKLLQKDFVTAIDNYDESKIKGIVTSIPVDSDSFGLGKLTGDKKDFAHAYVHAPSVNGNTPKVKYGKQPTEANEIAISDGLISLAMPQYLTRGYKYESLLNKPFYRHDGMRIKSNAVDVTPNVVGIVHNNIPIIYLPKSNEYALYDGLLKSSTHTFSLLNKITFHTKESYGQTIDESGAIARIDKKINVWVSTGAENYFNEDFASDVNLFNVRGIFENDGLLAVFDNETDLTRYQSKGGTYSLDLFTRYTEIPSDIVLTEGVLPTKVGEILVSDKNTLPLGPVIPNYTFTRGLPFGDDEEIPAEDTSIGYTIVGKYKTSNDNYNLGKIYTPFKSVYATSAYGQITQLAVPFAGDVSINYTDLYTSAVYSDNFKVSGKYLNSLHSESTQYGYKSTKAALNDANRVILSQSQNIIMVAVSAGIIVLMLVLVLISTRSNMIRHIYSISVFRSLGTKRSDVYRIFISKDLINYLFTIFLGVFITFLVDWIFAASFGVFAVPFWVFLLVLATTYGISLLGTMIPLWSLLSKTPNQIASKYDI